MEEVADPFENVWQPPDDLTAREVYAIEAPEVQEYWGPVATRGGRVVVGGKSGEGKSTLVMAITRAVAEGVKFLDWTGVGGTVFVVDLEQGLRTVQRQLERNGLTESDNVRYYRIPDGLDLATNETQAAWLLGKIVEHQPVMVVLDPLYKAHQGDSNDERAMVDMMRRLDKWRDEHGFCLVIPMHLRKTDPRSTDPTMDDIFGSGGLTRGAEVVLGIKKNHPGKSTLYFWKDRDGDLHEESKWKLDFTMAGGFVRDPEDKGPEPVDKIRKAFLYGGGSVMTLAELAESTGMSVDRTRRTIKEMEADGTLEMVGKGAHGAGRYKLSVSQKSLDAWEEMVEKGMVDG